ncbi:Gfo/Idh/MocA family oxidoreductase [Tessaracoccus terricola]
MSQAEPLRIGILGAAGITPPALIEPAAGNPDVRLVAVAARERARADAFAEEHGIERAVDSYEALLADPEVEAIYNPLPNSHHAHWSILALEAGKHVLVEKPFASNFDEAQRVAEVAAQHPELVLMEAFHNRYHALTHKVLELLSDGIIGEVRSADSEFLVHLPDRSDIRYNHDLSGGSTMDLGCYPLHFLRTLFGEPKVLSGTVRTTDDPRIDEALTNTLEFPGGITSTITSSLFEPEEVQHVLITGTRGTIEINGFVKPHHGNQILVTVDGETVDHAVPGSPTTYEAQLSTFVAAVREGAPVLTGPDDSLATMQVIDAMYVAAGLEPRPTVEVAP